MIIALEATEYTNLTEYAESKLLDEAYKAVTLNDLAGVIITAKSMGFNIQPKLTQSFNEGRLNWLSNDQAKREQFEPIQTTFKNLLIKS